MNIKLNGNGFFRLTSDFHSIDSAHPRPHTGIDIATPTGTKLYSPTDGVISDVVDYKNLNIGKGIIIKTEDGESLILGHLSDNSSVHVGQKVHTGDYLGLTGNTGHSTGAHLHVGLKDAHNHFINPIKYFNGNKPLPKTQIADAAHDIVPQVTTMNAGELLQNALSQFADTLSQMSLNVIHIVFNSSTFDLILETICTMLCI